ncbi:hypothetical protein BOTBODRAFT_34994 [Botryobasidium botryosum FD-172 SS1]|uniref:Uncharacterized protein n=1 Tax=Botryobasidium botryosum (strain FD-172 SS1) TaxID=930990 RepID=A0A067MK42_BOTB1|nr:hypothetical protein BOTBODRAFT_34994 [Botryobasidium botryosum FD-172 SS1]
MRRYASHLEWHTHHIPPGQGSQAIGVGTGRRPSPSSADFGLLKPLYTRTETEGYRDGAMLG